VDKRLAVVVGGGMAPDLPFNIIVYPIWSIKQDKARHALATND